ncbi:hypothetical protein Tco_1213587 [Tanacetum coccineum]
MSVSALFNHARAIIVYDQTCALNGKTCGFDRPRTSKASDTLGWSVSLIAPTRYPEIIWERSLFNPYQTFLTDRKNLATAARGKKKTAHLLIPSVRFTKLIIHHLRTKHNIHRRTDALLTDEIKGAPYYGDYQEHVAKYQQFLDEERGKTEKGGATESSEATKVTKHKAAKATKPAGDKAPKVPQLHNHLNQNLATTKPSKSQISEKKRKLVKETPDEPSPAKRSKGTCPYNEKDVDLERAMELSLMEQGAQTQGPARPVVIREPESRRIQLLPESSTHAESPSMDAELNLTYSEIESEEEASKINARNQEGRAGPKPDSQLQTRHVVHAGPNLECMDLGTYDASTQQKPEQMDEEFTTTAYPNV